VVLVWVTNNDRCDGRKTCKYGSSHFMEHVINTLTWGMMHAHTDHILMLI